MTKYSYLRIISIILALVEFMVLPACAPFIERDMDTLDKSALLDAIDFRIYISDNFVEAPKSEFIKYMPSGKYKSETTTDQFLSSFGDKTNLSPAAELFLINDNFNCNNDTCSRRFSLSYAMGLASPLGFLPDRAGLEVWTFTIYKKRRGSRLVDVSFSW